MTASGWSLCFTERLDAVAFPTAEPEEMVDAATLEAVGVPAYEEPVAVEEVPDAESAGVLVSEAPVRVEDEEAFELAARACGSMAMKLSLFSRSFPIRDTVAFMFALLPNSSCISRI